LSPRAKEELQTNFHRIGAAVSAAWLWERVLTEAERQRLGGDLERAWRAHGTAGMWMKLRGVSLPRAVVDVACELDLLDERTRGWLLRELGEAPDDPAEALETAIDSGGLVLIEHPRAAYWRGQPIRVDWKRRPALWDFFWEVCRNAKAGQAVDHITFNARDHGIVAKQKSRLLELRDFPRGLTALIRPAGRHAQKLNMPPEQIRLFEVVVGETVRERIP
jgi:hypothetical protein